MWFIKDLKIMVMDKMDYSTSGIKTIINHLGENGVGSIPHCIPASILNGANIEILKC